nr:MAG: capsid protein [Skomarfal virus 50]
MAYRRRTTNRRRNIRRRRPSRGKIYSRAAGQLWRDVQKLKNFVNVEFKATDVTLQSTVTTAPIVQLLNGLADGDTETNRNGDEVRFKSLQCDYQISKGSVDSMIFIAWVIDTKPTGTLPAFTAIWETPDAGNPTVNLRNLDQRTRFVILKSHTYMLNDEVGQRHLSHYRKMDMKTFYKGSTFGIADIQSNALYFICASNAATAGNAPVISSFNRLRYIDN